jgi:transposase
MCATWNPEKAEGLSPELQAALEPLLAALESLSEQSAEYNERIEQMAEQRYPQVALLKPIKGVGTLIALTFLLTLEDPHRFRKSRDVGCYLGLQPERRKSGQSEPQMHISKAVCIYERCWCREHSTFWVRLGSTAISDGGAETGRTRGKEREEAGDHRGGAEAGGAGERRSV